jgi:hypothetical protein
MNRHPSDENLLEYCESAEAPAAEQVRRHLETGCARCSERVASSREILAALRVSPLSVAPEAFVRSALEKIAALRQGQAPRTAIGAVKEKVRRVLEEVRLGLVLDTAIGASMQGIRGSAVSEHRQLMFESPLGNLHLQVEAGSGSYTVIGQLVPSNPADRLRGGVVRVEVQRGSPRGRLSETGEFRIEGVPGGTVRIRIAWAGRELVSDPIDLEAGLDE